MAAQVPAFHNPAQTGLFDKLVKIKYDVPNDQPELFDAYTADIDGPSTDLRAYRPAHVAPHFHSKG